MFPHWSRRRRERTPSWIRNSFFQGFESSFDLQYPWRSTRRAEVYKSDRDQEVPYHICRFTLDFSTTMTLFTKSTPRTDRCDHRRRGLAIVPIVEPISVRKSLPTINRCNDVFPTSVSPRRRTLYFTSKDLSLDIDRRCRSPVMNRSLFELARRNTIRHSSDSTRSTPTESSSNRPTKV